jgi:hypothetical protein
VLFIRIASFSPESVRSSRVTVRTKTLSAPVFVSVFPGTPTTWLQIKLRSYNERYTAAWLCLQKPSLQIERMRTDA